VIGLFGATTLSLVTKKSHGNFGLPAYLKLSDRSSVLAVIMASTALSDPSEAVEFCTVIRCAFFLLFLLGEATGTVASSITLTSGPGTGEDLEIDPKSRFLAANALITGLIIRNL
jgi:hypothetical protein